MYIAATAMVSPVGMDADSACAAMRAGISGFVELPYLDNNREPIVGAAVPGLDFRLRRADRIIELLALTLGDLLKRAPDLRPAQVPLLLGLAEPDRPGGCAALADRAIGRLEGRLGVRFHPQLSRALPTGHTAGFEAVRTAREHLQSAGVPACIACAADSYLSPASLLWLERTQRLKTSGNRDGVVPGEAASAVLLKSVKVPETATELTGLGFGQEAAKVLSDEPLLCQGLTDAARTALAEAKLGFHGIDLRLSDVTGELYGFKELALVESRLMRVVRKTEQPVWHWAQSIGDTGAAAGIAQLVLADAAFRKEYAPGETVLGLSSSVPGGRAAVVLRRTTR